MEMWMLPWINLFHTEQCRLALDYRYFMLPAARYLALLEDHEGARYPWESAFTGVETTPWILAAENQIHNTAGVSFAVQNWLLTNMPDSICPSFSVPKIESHAGSALKADHKQAERWFTERGLILLEEIARFWNSRMHFNEEKEAFEILHVMPPDEYTHCCRNSAYTNAIASLALAAPATFARRQAHPIKPEYLEWETRASRLWIPRDQAHQLMLEHEDYVLGTCVKQADTVLLTYPLQFDQPELWKRNMIDYYAGVTDPNGPAMTWSIFCICALELKDYERATDYFKRCLLHVKGPFLSWTETRDGSGAANFLTGAGGFLQTLVHGYCGLRMQLIEHHLVKPDCPDPTHRVTVLKLTPPIVGIPDHENMILWMRGLAFQGRRLHLKFNWSRCLIEIQLVAGSPLCLGSFSESGWVFDTVLLVGDAPIGRGGQSLCIVSQSALGGISVDNSLNSPCRLD
ncbi:Acid trehalase protein 1 [Fasciola hepatica]|uniref:Acid trehalase protein 1 n=1 Tax=Fasciola hepatica TaxID=6192 RepID=A0A4E0RVU2_FASHE|nr:Acid trehalase protein 1 [Fasciola hepatica]